MNPSANETPYRSGDRAQRRRRTILLVVAAVIVVAVGLGLHLAGILPPK